MQIVGRINFPKSVDVSSLYIQCNEGASIKYHDGYKEIVFYQGGIVSSNSYFNSFYERFYTKYTIVDAIYYLLKLQGDFQVSVYREVYGANNRELIFKGTFEKCQVAGYVKVLLPNLLEDENAGRIYFEIMCCSEHGLFKEGLIATEQNKDREVSLGIVSCTFKKETYIKNTVNTLLEDKLLQAKDFKIFVVDNGSTLNEDDFREPKLQLICNKNVGGSGGFTRGLVEALQENTYSHFLLMDDDIELDSECVYRLFSLYEYAKVDFAVAGSMLDLYKKHVLYEAGALYGKDPDYNIEFKPFSFFSLKNNLEVQNDTLLNLLLLEEDIDYGAFFFFAFSKELVEQIGLPMPFFVKVDDIEFCLRIKERFGGQIVAFPSIAVWHEPFYVKYPIWDNYYHYRNNLITYAIHKNLGYTKAVYHVTKELIFNLLLFKYNIAEMMIKGFEDYVKGPDILKSNEPEVLHANILELSKSYKTQNVQQNYLPPNQVNSKSRAGSLKKILSLLTLNGHLLPNFLTSDDDVFIWQSTDYAGQPSKAFGKRRVLIFKEGTTYLCQNEIDKVAGIKLLLRWFKVAAKSSTKWSSIITEWKTAASELTSTMFWQQYLGIKKYK